MPRLFIYLLPTLLYSALNICPASAQSANIASIIPGTPITVGQPAGDLNIPVILNSPISSGSLSSFKGKLLILEFWGIWCSPCIGSMPHMLDIQKKFGDKVQVLLIAPDSLTAIQDFYKRRPELRLPTAVGSAEVYELLAKRFGIPSLGHYIWIDAQGIVRGITGEGEVTPENIQAILDGKDVKLLKSPLLGIRKELDLNKPFMLYGNDGGVTDVKYHSVLTGYLPGNGGGTSFTNGEYEDRTIMIFNATLVSLFKTAISGIIGKTQDMELPGGIKFKMPPTSTDISPYRIKLEVADTTGLNDVDHSENIYCYQLIVPKNRADRKYQIMLSELEDAFGLTAKMEKRNTKVLTLVKIGNGPKPSAGGKKPEGKPLVFQFWNESAAELANAMEYRVGMPVLDETGLTTKFDLTWDELHIKHLDQVRKELRKNGLDLQEAEREVELMVIRSIR